MYADVKIKYIKYRRSSEAAATEAKGGLGSSHRRRCRGWNYQPYSKIRRERATRAGGLDGAVGRGKKYYKYGSIDHLIDSCTRNYKTERLSP